MADITLLQPSFAGGELAPSLYGRVDIQRYGSSLKTLRNFFVKQYGGASNRPGFEFRGSTSTATGNIRLIPFVFNDEQSYLCEFGDQYVRFWSNGVQIESAPNVPFELGTPYLSADLHLIKFDQSADVITLTARGYAPRELRRLTATTFSLALIETEFGPFRGQNLDESITVTASGLTGAITLTASSAIFLADQLNTPMRLDQVDMGTVERWQNRESGVVVAEERFVDERVYRAIGPGGNNTGDSPPAVTEGSTWDGPNSTIVGISGTFGVEWEYIHSGFGIVMITSITSPTVAQATVIGELPRPIMVEGTYRWSFAAWTPARGYPIASAYYQQRRIFGGSLEQPQTAWMSETGVFNSFKRDNPIVASNSISFGLDAREINEFRHLVSLKSLIAMTSGAAWDVGSYGDSGLAPDNIRADVQNFRGASHVRPVTIGETAIYVQTRGQQLRDLTYTFEVDGFTGGNLSTFSNHLFRGRTVVDMAYAEIPESIIWVVLDNGTLLSCTYVREQQMIAWARHETPKGEVKAVAVIPEGDNDVLYIAVERQINGSTVRFIERLKDREFDDLDDAFFVDSGLSYDGRNTTTTTMTLSGGTDWEHPNPLTLTASSSTFSAGSVDRLYRLYIDIENDDGFPAGRVFADLLVTAFTSDTVVTVEPVRIVPEQLRDVAVSEWALMATTLSGLDHLEGETLSILTDGNVHPQETVSSGEITLDYAAAVVHAGLGYNSDLETLPINSINPVVRDNKKLVTAVNFELEDTRGLFAGRSNGETPPDFENLLELKQRTDEDWAESTRLFTGLARIDIESSWDKNATIAVRQSDPLPISILSIMPEVTFGGKG